MFLQLRSLKRHRFLWGSMGFICHWVIVESVVVVSTIGVNRCLGNKLGLKLGNCY